MRGADVSRCVVVSGHHSGGRFTLLGIPGVYENGVPVPVDSTGKTEEELAALLASTDLAVEFIDSEDAQESEITSEEASAAESMLSRSDEVASEAGKTLAEFERQKKRRPKSAAKEG
jgi:hypothetical protein